MQYVVDDFYYIKATTSSKLNSPSRHKVTDFTLKPTTEILLQAEINLSQCAASWEDSAVSWRFCLMICLCRVWRHCLLTAFCQQAGLRLFE